MNSRLKEIRKALKLSQDEFGRRLGVSNTAISKLENSENKITDQTVKLVCSQFHVSYIWLTQGVGDMFESVDDNLTAMIDNILMGENETAKAVFRAFAKLDDSDWLVVKKIIDELKK